MATHSPPRVEAAVPVDDLRRRLTSFAGSLPNHDLKNLGALIKVIAASQFPIYRIAWTTQFEQRKLVEREKPYGDVPISAADSVNLSNIDVWKHVLPKPTSFLASSTETPLPLTLRARKCKKCEASGSINCDTCGGEGNVQCGGCNGTGTHDCSKCGGTGLGRKSRTIQKQRICPGIPLMARCIGGYAAGGLASVVNSATNTAPQICGTCNGTGVQIYEELEYFDVPCRSCGTKGSVFCEQCGRSGIIGCSICQSKGVLICGACEGKTKIARFLAIIQNFDLQRCHIAHPAKSIPAEAAAQLGDSEFELALERSSFERLPAFAVEKEVQPFKEDIAAARRELESRKAPDSQAAAHQLYVGRAFVYRLDYSFGQKNYTAWFAGRNGLVHAPVNPIVDRLSQLVETALVAWSKGDRSEAIWSMQTVIEMAKANTACGQILLSMHGRIPKELQEKATSFSLWFLWKNLDPIYRGVIIASLVVVLFCSGLITVGLGIVLMTK